MTAYLLALSIELHFPESGSLKTKRKELLSLRSVIGRRFGAAIAEVEHQDLWQRSRLAAGLVGGSPRELERVASGLERYLVERYPQGVRIERSLVSFADIF